MPELQRFVSAQAGIYPQALREIRSGTKRSHWMWFIFPQMAGLGHSRTAQLYAIGGLGEAHRYFAHPVLGTRLAECTDAMLAWAGKRSALAILGEIDALKFCSSMTLFEVAGLEGGTSDRFAHALDAFCQGRRDEQTLRLFRLTCDDGSG